MKEFDDLISVWKEQKESVLSVEQVLTNINTKRNKMALKLLLSILAMLASLVVMIAVWVYIDIEKFTTNLALTMLVSIVFIYAIIMFRNQQLLKNKNELLSPKEHLAQLKKIQKDQLMMSKYYSKVYFIILFTGLLLYYYEILAPASMLYKTVTYSVTIAWLFFAQFYLGKKTNNKNKAKMDEMISSLEHLEKQL